MFKIKVAAAIIRFNGRILLSSRPAGKTLAGYWEFPGGKIESTESPAQALRRELQEELDCEIIPLDIIRQEEHIVQNTIIELFFIRAICTDPQKICAMENQKFAWVTIEELSQYPILDADANMVKFLQLS